MPRIRTRSVPRPAQPKAEATTAHGASGKRALAPGPRSSERAAFETGASRPARPRPTERVQAPPARLTEANDAELYKAFLSARELTVSTRRGGAAAETSKRWHVETKDSRCAMNQVFVLDASGKPELVFKSGDTRAARTLRGDPYEALGMVGGRFDKEGSSLPKIGLGELAEEVGGFPLEGSFRQLGPKLLPTMPHETSERDAYFVAVVRSSPDMAIEGDGGGMELVGKIGRKTLGVSEALAAMDGGKVGEGARARVAAHRGLDAIGFIPELDRYVFDLPPALRARFDTLGLGAPFDPRGLSALEAAPKKAAPAAPAAPVDPLAAKVNGVDLGKPKLVPLDDDATLVDTRTQHLARVGGGAHKVGVETPNTFLHTDYDRAKIAAYYVDPELGPMVRLARVEREVVAGALHVAGKSSDPAENAELCRLDVLEAKVALPKVELSADGGVTGTQQVQAQSASRAREAVTTQLAKLGIAGEPFQLGAAAGASPGLSDLKYHFYGVKLPPPPTRPEGFVPVSEALRLCRAEGQGDTNTEALLLRLATHERWIPTLGMTVDQARAAAEP